MNRRELNLITLFIAIFCQANFGFELAIEGEPPWRNILNISKTDQTTFLDIENDTSVHFKDSILRSIHRKQSVTIFSGTHVPDPPAHDDENYNLLIKTNNYNVVFTIKFLNPSILDHPLLKLILKSHWFIVFILVSTKDNLYNCDHGKFCDEALKNIEEFLNILWRKHRTMYVFLNLPYVCPNDYVVFNDTKPTDGELYNRTIKLINTDEEFLETISRKTGRMLTRNYPLRGNIFYRFPTAIQDCSGTDIYIKTSQKNSGGFCGMDGLIMSDIVTHFQFNLSLPTLPPGYNKYGYQQPDGVLTGVLGHIVRGDVDVSFNSRFMAKYTTGLQNYRYLYHISWDALCAVLNQPGEEPLWQYPVNSFTFPQWLFILACLISIGVLMWVFARIKNRMSTRKMSTLPSYILSSINAGLFGFFLKRRNDLLLLRGACLYSSIITLATYQSYINYVFTTRRKYDTLRTLSDLVEAGTVTQTSPSIFSLINESYNELTVALLTHTIVLENTDSFDYVTHHTNTATLERRTDAIMLTLMRFTDKDGRPVLYVVNECIRVFYLSYISNLEFPFHKQLQMFMMRLVETGLPDMYYTWTSRALGLEASLPNIASEPRPTGKISMGEQVIAFGVLLVGYALSMIAFVAEIWWSRRRVYPFIP